MSVTSKMEGHFMHLTIDCSGTPYVSKSAIAKALAKGQDATRLEATSVATTGGFIRVGKFKVSANVTL